MTRTIVLLTALLGLAACETVEGFGEDVQTAGQAVENTAQEVEEDLEE